MAWSAEGGRAIGSQRHRMQTRESYGRGPGNSIECGPGVTARWVNSRRVDSDVDADKALFIADKRVLRDNQLVGDGADRVRGSENFIIHHVDANIQSNNYASELDDRPKQFPGDYAGRMAMKRQAYNIMDAPTGGGPTYANQRY